MNDHKHYARLLSIAGSDSGGGAGIQADLKTFSALGAFGMSAIAALTAQNTLAVTAIHPVPPDFLQKQIEAVFDDIGVDAVKIGMLATPELIAVVADTLARYGAKNIVLDPVMVAKSGDKLLQDNAIEALRTRLLPLATVITPNLPEASVLLGRRVSAESEMEQAAKDLRSLGAKNVLLKGGHLRSDKSADLLVAESGKCLWFEAERIETQNLHGTGCTYSSAIATFLGKGYALENAIAAAKQYITDAIRFGARYRLGGGHGPVHHFYKHWE
ncbi:MAG: bifunctional hydroxymethylpyrimidine kinase/phosphomethylpyrimidine kinase [Chloroherpetonaceae bacterium]|nr:bifunctional hydroxymethylpyrimidine kinase/phosphomethylpyrimidine kinase [Chloroherpetonaceae bacterium]MDW8437767.1 bifunctional hydroxymethylpyrimidine kinase/phosphomethylpyrimidine kinase [Chloroherpetonaceae bacterium]